MLCGKNHTWNQNLAKNVVLLPICCFIRMFGWASEKAKSAARSFNVTLHQFESFGFAMDKIYFPFKFKFGAIVNESSFCSKLIYLIVLIVISFSIFLVIPCPICMRALSSFLFQLFFYHNLFHVCAPNDEKRRKSKA